MAEFLGALFVLFFLVWIPCGLFAAAIAGDKGHSTIAWFFGGLFFGPIALIAAAGLGDRRLRRSIRRLVEQQDGTEEAIAANPGATPAPTLAPRDPNAAKSFMDKLDDAMDPDRNS